MYVNGTTLTPTTNATAGDDGYNSEGALAFTVVVLITYGSSILVFIGYSIKSAGKDRNNVDKEVQQFLTTKNNVNKLHVLDEVMQSRKLYLETGVISLKRVGSAPTIQPLLVGATGPMRLDLPHTVSEDNLLLEEMDDTADFSPLEYESGDIPSLAGGSSAGGISGSGSRTGQPLLNN